MKKFITFALAMGFVVYVSNLAAFAQGRGGGRGPAVSAGHAPEVNHSVDHGKPADHDQGKSAKTTKEAGHDADFENRIGNNPELKAKLSSMLPAGTDLKTASTGFKNAGQFIAALHVSKNLNIPFDALKAKMTGTNPSTLGTGTNPSTPSTLGQAIHSLKPTISESEANKEASKASKEAEEELKTKRI